MTTTTTTKTAHETERRRIAALLGSNYEVTLRFQKFAHFWKENPGIARYALQVQAREILHTERVRFCLRRRIRRGETIDVLHVPLKGSAHYGNLMTCASVWNCPVCAAKITTRRRQELSEGIKLWTDKGNRILLATFTLRHVITEGCAEVLTGLTKSYSKFWGDREGLRIRRAYCIAGRVRGLETTFTLENGWHTHIHDLWFMDIKGGLPPNLVEELQGVVTRHWQNVLSRHNRYADSLHGVDIRATERDIADYVAKYGKEDLSGIKEKSRRWKEWTEAHEVALAPIKRGSNRESFTPLQLLALALAGDEFAGRLFGEYAKAFKGKSQVRWSRGLRKTLGLQASKTDEELANTQEEHSLTLAQLDKDQWGIILGNAARSELLKIASTGNSWAVLQFLEDLGISDAIYPQLANDKNYFAPGWYY